jgi:hypothetical protein
MKACWPGASLEDFLLFSFYGYIPGYDSPHMDSAREMEKGKKNATCT